jgi:acyl dehydratase
MIDRKWIGYESPVSVLPIEGGRLRFFAKTIGETDPVYTDTTAARAAGYEDIPAPPTFLFAAEMESGTALQLLADLQIPIARLLHGEQKFVYHRPACAGDVVRVSSTVSDIYDKKNGILEFIVKTSRAVNQRDELVAEMRTVLVCRN